ncbi:hypothetical protein HDV05_003239 [Chytridiales sp. JEL 0842]|nr:hypothetical protein HDV05_003239 [Chytridiales sp. JEL 0842]
MFEMDSTIEPQIAAVATSLKERFGPKCIRLIVNASGYLNPEKSLSQVTAENMERHFKINTLAPLLVAKHLTPLFAPPLKNSPGVVGTLDAYIPRSVIAHLSAMSGSIEKNTMGGWHSYRISKAGLNMASKCIAAELGRKGAMSVCLHPGVVETELSKPHIKGAHFISPEEAAGLIWNNIKNLKEAHNGAFIDEKGAVIPW